MLKSRAPTQADFDALLSWLDNDRERAARRYEEIRSKLIRIFICRGSPIPEELADQTIDRVSHKTRELSASYKGDPALYFYGVARNVFRESLKKHPIPPPRPQPIEEDSSRYDCLDKCMQQLPPETRQLILSYYQDTGQAKIDHRRQLAQDLGIDVNALRIRTHRLRTRLQQCVNRCLDGGGARNETGKDSIQE